MKAVSLCLLLLIGSCASRMRGHEARPSSTAKAAVKVTARLVPDLSVAGYHVVEVYLLNLQDRWERMKHARLVEVGGIEDFQVIEGEDLMTWKKSMLLEFDLKEEEAKKEGKPLPSKSIKKRLASLEIENAFPGNVSLPPKLQVEKWLVVKIPEGKKMREFKLEMTYMDSDVISYQVSLPEAK